MDINQDLVAIERIYKAAINTPVYYLSTNLARHWFFKVISFKNPYICIF